MSVAPAGWYPDPEKPGAKRHWNGQAWGPQLPAPKPKASKVLLSFAILCSLGALMGPVLSLGAALLGGGIGYAFGAPQGNLASGIGEIFLHFARGAADAGLVLLIIGLALLIIASVRKPRPKILLVAAWSLEVLGALCIVLVYSAAAFFGIQPA